VTIIIGLICKGAIVLAADSQTTRDGMKRTDAKKISVVKFGDGAILVAEAGNAGNSARAIELLKEAAKETKITDYRQPADMARSAMIRVKRELQEQYGNCTALELQELILRKELQAELMLGYYFDHKPYLYTVDLAVTRCDKKLSWWSAVGCGANLGSYLLNEHTKPDMDRDVCTVLAGYIVETVCKYDAYCSSPANVGCILDDIGEASARQNNTSVNPKLAGLGLVVVASSRHALAKQHKLLDRLMQTEKDRRNKAILHMILKETERDGKVWKSFFHSKTPDSASKIAALVKRWGIQSFDAFKSAVKS
jgi:20S proteasome alpha/beta subunit